MINFSSKKKKILVFVVILLIALNFTGLSNKVRNLFFRGVAPFQASFWSRGISMHSSEFEEVDREKSTLLSEIRRLKGVEEENEQLREALDLDLREDFELELARVIGKGEEDFVIVSKGESDGVKEGMPVVTARRGLVGKVDRLMDDFSYVKLVTHPEVDIEVEVEEVENSIGLLQGGASLSVEMISREADIEEGDRVITYPGGNMFPAGLYVGEVKSISRGDAEALQSVELIPAFRFGEVNSLFIITNF